jgi:hypothetical protein
VQTIVASIDEEGSLPICTPGALVCELETIGRKLVGSVFASEVHRCGKNKKHIYLLLLFVTYMAIFFLWIKQRQNGERQKLPEMSKARWGASL